MTYNLENALHGLQEARTALVLEGGNPNNTLEQEDSLEVMEDMVDSLVALVNDY